MIKYRKILIRENSFKIFLIKHKNIFTQMENDLISFNIKKNKTKVTLIHMYIVLFISKPTISISMREMDNRKRNVSERNKSVYNTQDTNTH